MRLSHRDGYCRPETQAVVGAVEVHPERGFDGFLPGRIDAKVTGGYLTCRRGR